MKSENEFDEKVNRFWRWFSSIADALGANIQNRALLQELDDHVTELNPDVSWEIGPSINKEWSLTISPNLNRELWPTTRQITQSAPMLLKWDFYAERQPKEWDFKFQIEEGGRILKFDASTWSYVLLKYPDGDHELLIEADVPLPKQQDVRWQIGALLLEGTLGEALLLERVECFELVEKLPAEFVTLKRSITELPMALNRKE